MYLDCSNTDSCTHSQRLKTSLQTFFPDIKSRLDQKPQSHKITHPYIILKKINAKPILFAQNQQSTRAFRRRLFRKTSIHPRRSSSPIHTSWGAFDRANRAALVELMIPKTNRFGSTKHLSPRLWLISNPSITQARTRDIEIRSLLK